MKKIGKKAEVEIQFNWIFILIAGAVILALFTSIARFQKKNTDYTINSNLLDHMQALLAGARISAGTDYSIEMPDLTLQIECDRYKIKGSGLEGKRLTYWTFFGMGEQSGDRIYMASRPWMSPFLVDYVLYITSDNVRYTIIEGGLPEYQRFAEDLYDALPKNTVKEKVSGPNAMIDRGHAIERLVTFNINDVSLSYGKREPSKLFGKNKKMSLINILDPSDIEKPGAFEYWEFDDDYWWRHIIQADSAYLDKPTLIGAVYAEHNRLPEFDLYRCNMEKLFTRLNFVSTVYMNRSQTLYQDAINQQSTYLCSGFYDPTKIAIINRAVNQSNSSKLTLETMEYIEQQTNSLRNDNIRLQSMGCPTLY